MTAAPHEAGPEYSGPASGASDGLQAHGLIKAFAGRTVVHGVDLVLAPGEILALTGSNGSGKTTLLRLLAGVLDPDDGTVAWKGVALDESDPWIRRELACVLDDVGTFPDLSVGEHVELLARAFAVDDPVTTCARVLTEVGLAGARDQLPSTLSSGQRHRLGLASALVRPASLLVLDEPEQRLDVAGRQWLAGRLRALADDGAAVVIASHDGELVADIADLVLDLS